MITQLIRQFLLLLFKLPARYQILLSGKKPITIGNRTLATKFQLILSRNETAKQLEDVPLSVARARIISAVDLINIKQIPVKQIIEKTIDGPHGPIPIRIYRPETTKKQLPTIIYYQGGGFVFGGLDSIDRECRYYANHSDCNIVAVDYRLAPENKFPVAFDDAFAAFRWVQQNTVSFGGDPERIAVAGDSSGGNLAAAICLECNIIDERQPMSQILICPITSAQLNKESHTQCGVGFGLTTRTLKFFFNQYLDHPQDASDPRCSPLLADNMKGLPPALIFTAGFDPLRNDGELYAQRLREAGVRVQLKCFDNLIHGFTFFSGVIPEAHDGLDEMARRIKMQMHGALDGKEEEEVVTPEKKLKLL